MVTRGTTPFTADELAILATYQVPRPEQWELSSPALVVVDIVESFVGRDVPVAEAQQDCATACGENAWRAIERIVPMLEAFRRHGAPVAFSTLASYPLARGAAPRRPASSLRTDRVVAPLAPIEGEYSFAKPAPSAFFGTALLAWLIRRKVDQVVIVGGATSGCVRATTVDASSYGLDVLLAEDGCFDRVLTSHDVAVTELDTKYSRRVRCAEVVERLDRS
jgi:nicotinamidase-related amidase